MFSGIVEGKGKVLKIKDHGDYLNIEISPPSKFNKGLKKGASISVNGVCLTSKDNGSKTLKFDVITETLKRTSLKNIQKGDVANLERSIKASSEIGGHLMSGHIHYTGKITVHRPFAVVVGLRMPPSSRYAHIAVNFSIPQMIS